MILSNPNILGGDLDLAVPPGATGLVGIASPSSTDNAIVRWDGTTGDLVQNSVVTIADTTGAIAGCQTITGGAANMTITAGTGNSRTLALQTTTSGGTATTALTLNATQDATIAGDLTVSGGNVGVGSAADGSQGVRVTSNALSGAAQVGVLSNPVFTSAATTSGISGYFRAESAAASFTMADGIALRALTPIIGSGSAITTATGLHVQNQGATGITNAYGIDIAAQSGAATVNVGLRNAGTTLFTNTTAATSSVTGAFRVGNDTAATTVSIGGGSLQVGAAAITVGSGTGLTVNSAAEVTRVVHKVTTTYAAFAAAGLTADKTIATLPAKTRLVAAYADVTATFTGGAVSDADITLGNTAGGAQYLASFDVDTATGRFGLLDADMGTELTRAAAIQGSAVVAWAATTTVTARLTTVGANTDQLTTGSITWYLVTEKLP